MLHKEFRKINCIENFKISLSPLTALNMCCLKHAVVQIKVDLARNSQFMSGEEVLLNLQLIIIMHLHSEFL